jgi:RNA polymerase sigma-70 factor (sigma-E family)
VTDGDVPELDFDQFVEAELPRMIGFARALTRDSHDAWDLLQDAIVRVAPRWNRVRRNGNPAAYVRTTMANLNIDRLRRRRRETLTDQLVELEVEPAYDTQLDAWFVKALGALSPNQRTVVVLHFVDDLDAEAIARAIGCSAGTVRSHLSRALDRLRAAAPSATHTEQGGHHE